MPSLTVENYLKAVLQIAIKTGSDRVTTGELAEKLQVAPGTVTSMLKTLSESRLAEYRPYEGVQLTDAGRALALRMVRRHRLIELFLVQTLNLTWDQVHEEAEHMEHAVSEFLIDHIDAFLGHPEFDPHGAPIPSAEGTMRGIHPSSRPLTMCDTTERVRFVRVVNQEPEFLRFLSRSGFEIGAIATVIENNRDAGIVTVEVHERSFSMGAPAAESIRVVSVE